MAGRLKAATDSLSDAVCGHEKPFADIGVVEFLLPVIGVLCVEEPLVFLVIKLAMLYRDLEFRIVRKLSLKLIEVFKINIRV